MKYSIHGPFKIQKQKNGLVDYKGKQAKEFFWDQVQDDDPSLQLACGCYLFAIKAAKGIKPWYVGLAMKQAFEKECFAAQKINIYNQALAGRIGTPLLFFIAKRTKKNKFVKPSTGKDGYQDVKFLETIIIGAALEKNPKLLNTKKTKYLKKMCVPSLINTPQRKPYNSEIIFKEAITK